MSIINIESQFGLVRIQAIDNSFTQKFLPQFKEMLGLFPTKYRLATYGSCYRTTPAYVEKQIAEFTACIAELDAMGTNFPYLIDPSVIRRLDLETQLLMNQLHRSFTTAHRSHDYAEGLHWNDRFQSAFTVPADKIERMLYLTDQINALVHNTEIYCKTPRKDYNQANLARQIEIRADSYVNDNTRMIASWFSVIEQADYQYFSDSNEFDVWVGKDILGKDYIVAYYEHDDASEWDVDHSIGYSGKIAIDASTVKRADVIKSDDFKLWLAEGQIEYTPAMCGMPVGSIIEGHEVLPLLLTQCTRNGESSDMTVTIE